MNNDAQIIHLDARIDKIMAELRVIQGGLYNKLRIAKVIQKSEDGQDRVLNVIGVDETSSGVVIRVV